GRFTACRTGDRFTVGPVEAEVVGGRHAVIHPDIPAIDNAGFLLGTADRPGLLLHPGDELSPPGVPVQVLALPATAPWSKLEETIDYYRAVAPEVAVPIHDAIVSDAGRGLYFGQLTAHGPAGSRFLPLAHGVPVDQLSCPGPTLSRAPSPAPAEIGGAGTGRGGRVRRRAYARALSIAETSSAAPGSVRGRKRPRTSPSAETRNFSKFHWMSPASPSAS